MYLRNTGLAFLLCEKGKVINRKEGRRWKINQPSHSWSKIFDRCRWRKKGEYFGAAVPNFKISEQHRKNLADSKSSGQGPHPFRTGKKKINENFYSCADTLSKNTVILRSGATKNPVHQRHKVSFYSKKPSPTWGRCRATRRMRGPSL